MDKNKLTVRLLLSPNLTPFFWALLLAACTPGSLSPDQNTPAAAYQVETVTAVTVKATPDTEIKASPISVNVFDCASVNQVPVDECEVLVALYDDTGGTNWVDSSGWLDSNDPCNWTGILCERGHVTLIDLSYNELTGSLPPELGKLSRLRALYLGGNRLSGPIPAEIGDLSELVTLEAGGNRLEGALPAELENLSQLKFLGLFGNQISGSIPPALGKLGQLDTLNLSNNQLSGSIPAELGDLQNLTMLYLSHNGLSGPIPDSFNNLSNLIEIDLRYNQLEGSVPEYLTQISQRLLWGNHFEGTITADGEMPFRVDYQGVRFSADPSLASSIWPEAVEAVATPAGGPAWIANPAHLRFTFADPLVSLERRRMGSNLAAEAQIFVYPIAELADIDPLVQTQIETLKGLLSEKGSLSEGNLPLLPLANSLQVFHAKPQYLEFGDIQGLRFLSQHSQDPLPYVLRSELFYTFQGLTNDGAYYMAAFFPISTAIVPAEIQIDDWDSFVANYDAYLAETTAALDGLPPAEFSPDLDLLDAVVTSLQVEPAIGLLLPVPVPTMDEPS